MLNSYRIWPRVNWQVVTDVSEGLETSVFIVVKNRHAVENISEDFMFTVPCISDTIFNIRPTRCNTKQSISYTPSSLHVSRVLNTPIIRSTQNCNYSLRYWSYFLVQLPPSNAAKLATLKGGSCTSTGGFSYSFVYSWWRVWLTPETCGVSLQNNK